MAQKCCFYCIPKNKSISSSNWQITITQHCDVSYVILFIHETTKCMLGFSHTPSLSFDLILFIELLGLFASRQIRHGVEKIVVLLRSPRCKYSQVLMQAPDSDWTPTLRDKRSTTSYLIVDGNPPPSVASLHLDPLLPEDLWWAPSPGCPPPTPGKIKCSTH